MRNFKLTSKRMLSVEPSITLMITSQALDMKNAGEDVIILSAGEPDYITPEYIRKEAINAINNGFTHYTQTAGIPQLRKAIVQKLKQDNNLDYDISGIIVSTGAKQSIYNVVESTIDSGDEVIIPSPYWVSYPEMVKLSDGKPVIIKTEKNKFMLSAEELERNITERTKIVLINSPNNPTGVVYDEKTLKELSEVIVKHNLLCISDEIYEKVTYNGVKHISIASLGEDIKERTIVVNGFSKAYAMTGWRIGYAAGPKEIIQQCIKLQGHSTSCPSSIGQAAALAAISSNSPEVEEMHNTFNKRRIYLKEYLDKIDSISYVEPLGAFYYFIKVDNFYGKNGINDSVSFAKYLLEKANIAVTPGKAFGNDKYIRISYAISTKDIERAIMKFDYIIKDLSE
jgi:aspartate aminotransferase